MIRDYGLNAVLFSLFFFFVCLFYLISFFCSMIRLLLLEAVSQTSHVFADLDGFEAVRFRWNSSDVLLAIGQGPCASGRKSSRATCRPITAYALP